MPNLVYEKINWEDAPSRATPINAANLNWMDNGIAALFDALNTVETNVDTINDTITTLRDSVTALQSSLAALTERVTTLENKDTTPDTEAGSGA